MDGLRQAQEKMRAAGVHPDAIAVFTHYYGQLSEGSTGLVLEDTIEPYLDPARLDPDSIDPEAAREALDATVIIKLNGGLGTGMGLDRAKTQLPVRDGDTFLDLIVRQVLNAREAYGVRLPLLFMDSFRTQADTLATLAHYPDLPVDGLPLDFLQNSEPKLLASDLTPVEWPADPSLEWCPPGHGDLYTAILASGVLDALLAQGYRYASAANADNLGSAPNAGIAGWFAASGAPYAAEVCLRTPADRKGGHLARRRSDGRLILRDTAQTAPAEMNYFTDEHRHPYFHTNNLWFDLRALRAALKANGTVLGLPLIRNAKTVDPTDASSPRVFQLETAMGAAIEVFEGALAIAVERGRFLPVKSTNDLVVLRSDAYVIGADGIPRLRGDHAPVLDLDTRFYKNVADLEARFPDGVPSLRAADTLTVHGDWTFGRGVSVVGDATLEDSGRQEHVPDGATLETAGNPA